MKNTPHKNLWEVAKAVLRGEFIALNVYIWKEKCLKSILSFHLIKFKKQWHKLKVRKRKERIKLSAESNGVENR